jgi:hypothetical protein
MKLSISVPDELWSKVSGPNSSPSEVVQRALNEMAQRRQPGRPFAHAPDDQVIEECKSEIDLAIESLLSERRYYRGLGYKAGAMLAADDYLDTEWYRFHVTMGEPEELRTWLNEGEQEAIKNRILVLADEVGAAAGGQPSQEFMAGLVGALFDIWHEVDNRSEVKEGQ